VEESLKDVSLIELAHSNSHYDNVGTLYYSNDLTEKKDESQFRSKASAVYIGDGICLTAAHVRLNNINHAVRFEINGRKTSLYHISEFIIHPNYEENDFFDIAVLVLDKPVDGLDGLAPCYEFSKEHRYLADYQHLLTYIGYGVKLIGNDWFYCADQKRRALQAYTYGCNINPTKLGIYSTPYRNSNTLTGNRATIPYEEKGRESMSGGAVIHSKYGLVSIFAGTKELKDRRSLFRYTSLFFICFINIVLEQIDYYLFPVIFINKTFSSNTSVMWSIPLDPVKDWIEGIRATCKV
jgi:hypothetical protein